MSTMPKNPNADQIAAAIDTIAAGLDKAANGLATLRQLFAGTQSQNEEFDPKDPRNKHDVGGTGKLTPRGVEICYRLFDQGLTRYAVSQAMGISFGGATHRYDTWQKAGGINRQKQPLD